jgi:uroporphyrin-3 C-methyltransferase
VTEQTETPKILDQISKSTNASTGSTRKLQNARRRFLVVLVLILPLIGAIGFLGYTQFQMQAQFSNMTTEDPRIAALQATIQSQQAELQALRDTVANLPTPSDSLEPELRTLEARFGTELEDLNSQLAELSLQRLQTASPQDSLWKILEANYLARLAAQKLQLEGDMPTALALMLQADAALVESNSNNSLGVRQELARDIEALRNTPTFDRQAVVFRLQNLAGLIDGLDLLSSQRENYMNRRSEQSEPISIGSDANGMLDSGLEFLGSVFVWRKWEDTPDAMLVPGQEAVIKQSFRLMLEQAQLAVLGRDNGLYQRHIDNGIEWLRRYTLLESASGQSVLAELTDLRSLDVNSSLPGLSASLSALEQLAATVR